MGKTISILFLLVFFGSQAGYQLVYTFQQYQIREEVKKQLLVTISDASLEMIVANQQESFRWEEAGKEFYQDGQLYDVVKSLEKDGKTILYCINDKKEEALLYQLEKTRKSDTGKIALQLLKVQLTDIVIEQLKTTISSKPVPNRQYFGFDASLMAKCKEVNAPPPRI